MLLVSNCDLVSMGGVVHEKRDLLIDGGKFLRIEPHIDPPAGCEIIDAAGRLVTPGLIEPHCHIGMNIDGVGGTNEKTAPLQPGLRALDGLDIEQPEFARALETGITTVVTGPGSSNLLGGVFSAVKTGGADKERRFLRKEACLKLAIGENPKMNYGRKGKSPATAMGAAALLREQFARARAYRGRWLAHLEKLERGEPDYFALDPALHSLMRVYDGMRVKMHAHTATDIRTCIRIAEEFGFPYSIEHCTEGHLMTDELLSAAGKYICGPTLGGQGKLEIAGKRFDSQARLERAGVEFAITTDASVIPIEYMLLQLCVLVSYGLSELGALRGVSINAARATDIADRVGSIEVGKDADLVIWNVGPLETAAETAYVLIDGEVCFERGTGACS